MVSNRCRSIVLRQSLGSRWCSTLSISSTARNLRHRKSTTKCCPLTNTTAFCSNPPSRAARSSRLARASGADHAPASTSSRAVRRWALPWRGPAANSAFNSLTVHRFLRTACATSVLTSSSCTSSSDKSATARAGWAVRVVRTTTVVGMRRVARIRTHSVERTRQRGGTSTSTSTGSVTQATPRPTSAAAPEMTDGNPANPSAAANRSGHVKLPAVRYVLGRIRSQVPRSRRPAIARGVNPARIAASRVITRGNSSTGTTLSAIVSAGRPSW